MMQDSIRLSFEDMLSLTVFLRRHENDLDEWQLRIFDHFRKILFEQCTVNEYEHLDDFYERYITDKGNITKGNITI